jgi:hypothetical protein
VSLATIRAALKTRLETVTDVGVVSDWEPYVSRDEDLQTYFKSDSLDYLCGWTITRESTQEQHHTMVRKNLSVHTMVLRGYRALDEVGQTEQAFQDLVEAVCAALRVEIAERFSGTVVMVDPPQVRIVEPRTFTEALVHYAEIAVKVAAAVGY